MATIIEIKNAKELPPQYVGFLLEEKGKDGYTVESALDKFERTYHQRPDKVYKWNSYLIVPRV